MIHETLSAGVAGLSAATAGFVAFRRWPCGREPRTRRSFVRLGVKYRWRGSVIVADLIPMEPGDFPIMCRELPGIARRAEALCGGRRSG